MVFDLVHPLWAYGHFAEMSCEPHPYRRFEPGKTRPVSECLPQRGEQKCASRHLHHPQTDDGKLPKMSGRGGEWVQKMGLNSTRESTGSNIGRE